VDPGDLTAGARALTPGGHGREVLDWIAGHRTDTGSIPEKVLSDGAPASVAPLAWSAANVLLTVDSLRR
jgi:GH15 family glucan-1,4-alpha-glucosidase